MPKSFLIKRKNLLKFLTACNTDKKFEKSKPSSYDVITSTHDDSRETLALSPLQYSVPDDMVMKSTEKYHSYYLNAFQTIDHFKTIKEKNTCFEYFGILPTHLSPTNSYTDEKRQSYSPNTEKQNAEHGIGITKTTKSETDASFSPTDERPFVCTICGKSFRLSSTLCRHKIIHTSQRPHKCDVCNKSFNRSSTLKTHLRTHNKTKEFICTVCNKGFHQKGNLRNHVLIHTGEKPYSCHFCAKAFNKLSNLKFHMHTHTDQLPYRCRFCKKSMARRGELKQHIMMMHHEERLKEIKGETGETAAGQ